MKNNIKKCVSCGTEKEKKGETYNGGSICGDCILKALPKKDQDEARKHFDAIAR